MILFFGSKKLLTDFYNVSGTHGDQHVALGKIFVQIVFDFRIADKGHAAILRTTSLLWQSQKQSQNQPSKNLVDGLHRKC